MAGPDDFHAFALTLLNVCVEALDSIPTSLDTGGNPLSDSGLIGAPARRFVSPGAPVWDCCEQLTVHGTPLSEADTTPGGLDAGRRAARYARINHVSFFASITRCIPTAEMNSAGNLLIPEAEELTLAGRQGNADAWALWNHVFNAVHAGQLSTLCDQVFFDGITPFVPLGGCAGWQMRVRASLGGYTELLGS